MPSDVRRNKREESHDDYISEYSEIICVAGIGVWLTETPLYLHKGSYRYDDR